MLLELNVTGFATIDALQVHFLRPGLNILTGETGAGKTILLKAMQLLLGGKASADVVRGGKEQAVIEGAFDISKRLDLIRELDDLGLASGDENLVLRRIISNVGKNRIYINGHISTLNILERVAVRLVEITGQHEHHSLRQPAAQLEILDRFAGLEARLLDYKVKYAERGRLLDELDALRGFEGHREQRLDFLRFQLQEIESFNPQLGEDQELQSKIQRTRFSKKLAEFVQASEATLYSGEGSISTLLNEVLRQGEPLVELDSRLRGPVQSLREALVLVDEAAFGFRDYGREEFLDAAEVEQIESRMSDLRKLQRKYGTTVEEILASRGRLRDELSSLENAEAAALEIQSKIAKLEALLEEAAQHLHVKRCEAAEKLSKKINQELGDLNMLGSKLSVQVEKTDALGPAGFSETALLMQTSPQDAPKPLSRIASGGELSRVMLAIKQVVGASEVPMTYLFDEVDTGVSGPTAERVGRKLKKIGNHHQVISITHLPQVASFADAHFLITKHVSKSQVHSEVRELTAAERVKELSRLISGEKVTTSSLAHARQMIQQSKDL